MRQFILIICGLLILAACRTAENYNAELNGWIGKPEKSLVAEWGEPDSTFSLGQSGKIITYSKKSEEIIPSQYTFAGPDFTETLYAPFTYQEDFIPETISEEPGYVIKNVCQTSFHVRDGIIRSWQWRGNNCAAY